jgi:hypothetical protein
LGEPNVSHADIVRDRQKWPKRTLKKKKKKKRNRKGVQNYQGDFTSWTVPLSDCGGGMLFDVLLFMCRGLSAFGIRFFLRRVGRAKKTSHDV